MNENTTRLMHILLKRGIVVYKSVSILSQRAGLTTLGQLQGEECPNLACSLKSRTTQFVQ